MKYHFVLKLDKALPDDLKIPDWVRFITDKSVIRERLIPEMDRLMDSLGIKFWVTREYRPGGADWNDEEKLHGLNRTYRLILQDDYELPSDLLERMRRIPSVESASKLEIGESRFPRRQIAEQTSLGRPGDLIYLSYAKALTRGVPSINVAILDTGVNLSHKELEGKIGKRYDFVDLEGIDTTDFIGHIKGYDDVVEDEVGHGTHVSGIVAGRGLAMDEGISPDCTLMVVRVLATMKSGSRLVGAGIIDNINVGIKWAVDNGADVINMSLGIKHTGGGLPHEDVIRYAISKGVTVVAASGNDGTAERYYPGALPGVIAVGATDNTGAVTNFTSYGANITVVAPGLNVYSSFAHNTYAVASGTSQASPFVAGTVALMKSYAAQQGGRLTNEQVAVVLKATSDRVDSRMRNERAGYGLINLADAFKFLTQEMN
jgi:subtilisin family serine protease